MGTPNGVMSQRKGSSAQDACRTLARTNSKPSRHRNSSPRAGRNGDPLQKIYLTRNAEVGSMTAAWHEVPPDTGCAGSAWKALCSDEVTSSSQPRRENAHDSSLKDQEASIFGECCCDSGRSELLESALVNEHTSSANVSFP